MLELFEKTDKSEMEYEMVKMRNKFKFIFITLIAFLISATLFAQNSSKPNIVIILGRN